MKLALISPYYTNQPSGANIRFESIAESCGRILGDDLIVVTCKGNKVKGEGRVLYIPNSINSGIFGRVLVYVWLSVFQLYCVAKGIRVITDFNPVILSQFFSSTQFQLIHDARAFSKFGRWGNKERIVMTFLWKKIKKIITVSHSSKESFVKHLEIPSNRVIVSYNGVDTTLPIQSSVKDIDILYVSTFEYRKNHIQLLKALLLVETSLKVVFVGYDNGEKYRIDEFLAENEIIHKIEFLSGVTKEELQILYSKTKLFVFPSLYEGFGMPLIEAASNGVRVLCSNLPVFEELMNDSATYFDPNDFHDIARCIKRGLCSIFERDVAFDLSPFDWDEISSSLLIDIGLLKNR